MFIVKLVKDLTNFGMGYDEYVIAACGTIKSAIAESEKVIEEELKDQEKMIDFDDKVYVATKDEFARWSNAINGSFKFFDDGQESIMVEIMEVKYVD